MVVAEFGVYKEPESKGQKRRRKQILPAHSDEALMTVIIISINIIIYVIFIGPDEAPDCGPLCWLILSFDPQIAYQVQI